MQDKCSDDPEGLRKRAKQCRQMAPSLKSLAARNVLMEIADDYDEKARRKSLQGCSLCR